MKKNDREFLIWCIKYISAVVLILAGYGAYTGVI